MLHDILAGEADLRGREVETFPNNLWNVLPEVRAGSLPFLRPLPLDRGELEAEAGGLPSRGEALYIVRG